MTKSLSILNKYFPKNFKSKKINKQSENGPKFMVDI